ncbi:MAG TPA: FAD-dependent oxidoreductase, partial [Blastocatellia bacterium]|nr:FAD-dependent oxidoreductase [Blastocatellia bacterium]
VTTSLFGLAEKIETARFLNSIAKIDPAEVASVSLRDWLNQHIAHETVRELLLAVFRVTTYANAPDLMSAGAALAQLQISLAKGVLYLDGGWQGLVDALAEAARASGVIIETSARVEAVERDRAGRVESVRLADGRWVRAAAVLIAASPQVASSLVKGSETTSLKRWAEQGVAVKAACLDLALDALPKPRATFALGIDRPLYLSVHSASARLAPEGGALIHLAKYLAPGQDGSDAEAELEQLMELLQPGWRDRLVYRRFLPDMIVAHRLTTASEGGTEGRPRTEVADVEGLFIAGDWVGPEGLLADASLASAKSAAERVLASLAKPIAVAVRG